MVEEQFCLVHALYSDIFSYQNILLIYQILQISAYSIHTLLLWPQMSLGGLAFVV